MNRLPGIVRQHIAALRMLLVFTVITGIIYPVVVWGIAQGAFHNQANGSLISYHGRTVGSGLLCQEFVDSKGHPLPQYFQPRPSFAIVGWSLAQKKDGQFYVKGTGPDNYGCNPLFSSASNLGPTNPAEIQFIKQRQRQIAAFDHVKISQIPADAVTGSASGLDPDITPQNAAIQVARVAAARHIRPATVRALVKKYTIGRDLGILGEPAVNVLKLNIALDAKYPV
ncbi:MAG TPA: K(+)-transporting ATPase subunit C [Streptosporangiaceae bacterium]|nr:K(+)-transporting ATPase subunit C [Streptosporangiaceae bacterium]